MARAIDIGKEDDIYKPWLGFDQCHSGTGSANHTNKKSDVIDQWI